MLIPPIAAFTSGDNDGDGFSLLNNDDSNPNANNGDPTLLSTRDDKL
jgi:hypothetical protein